MSEAFTIGIPVKNEVDNIPRLRLQISRLINLSKYQDLHFEVLINDNLSIDGSSQLLLDWANSDNRIKLYVLTIPLGFQSTVRDLMSKATGKGFALFQSDLQDPVETLERMIDLWLLKPNQIVAGKIIKRKESVFINLSRRFFYFLLDASSDKRYVNGFQDFYVLPKHVYGAIARLPKENLFIRGYINYTFANLVYVDYGRDPRISGNSKFNFVSMYDLALDGLLLYGRNFIRLISLSSFLIFSVSLLGSLFLVILWLTGYDSGVRGWMSIALGISGILSFLGLVIGILLEYLVRIYRRLQLTQN